MWQPISVTDGFFQAFVAWPSLFRCYHLQVMGIIEESLRTSYNDKLLLFDGVSIRKFLVCVNNNPLNWHNMLGKFSIVILSILLAISLKIPKV